MLVKLTWNELKTARTNSPVGGYKCIPKNSVANSRLEEESFSAARFFSLDPSRFILLKYLISIWHMRCVEF